MWFWFAFGSAALGGIDVMLNKLALHKVSAAVLTWSLFTLSTPVLVYIVFKNGLPTVNQLFYIGVGGSALTFVFSKTITNQTLKHNLISKVFPLTAFNGLFTYLFGLLFLAETIRLLPIIGLFSIIVGSYVLNADRAHEDLLKPFKVLVSTKESLLFLIAILLNSITAVFDKIGLNNTYPSNPAFTLLNENIIMIIMLTLYMAKKEKATWLKELKNNFGLLFLNSIIYLFVSLLVFTAFTGAQVALVMGIKRLQIFFILFLGMMFFKDKPTKYTWLATIIMALGALLIKIG